MTPREQTRDQPPRMPASAPRRDTTIGPRIRQLRTSQGLTQQTAATRGSITVQAWRRWEQGRNAPRPDKIPRIAAALGVPVEALFVPDGMVAVTAVNLSPEAVARVRKQGLAEAERLAELVAAQLPALIVQACRKPKTGSRGKPRRTRAEKLSGVAQASAMRAARDAREAAERSRSIGLDE